MTLLQTLAADPTRWVGQEVGASESSRVPADASSPVERVITGRNTMYIGLGTILLIVLIFLLFRAMSGRRV
jgi:hypothetical protein